MQRKTFDLSLYLVIDPDLCGGPEGVLRTARLAAANGATVVQLRAPDWKKRQWLETAIALKAALSPFAVPLIINNEVDVALAVDADGVHVGQEDFPPAKARRLLGPEKILGLSASSAAHLAGVPDEVDYLGVGPVYPTGTKLDAAPTLGVAAFAERVASTRLPVVAIGGIRDDNCQALFAAGARGVAVVSAICGQPDPAATTAALRKKIMESLSQTPGQ